MVLLQFLGPKARSIPIVESNENKLLLYSVQAQSLRKFLFSYYNRVCILFDVKTREKMNKYFSSLYAISQINFRKLKAKPKPDSEEELVIGFMKNENTNAPNHLSDDSIFSLDDESKAMIKNRKASVLHVSEFYKKELDDDFKNRTTYSAKSEFWNTTIDYNHEF